MQDPTNGWQNIGIMWKYAVTSMPHAYRCTFMSVVEQSFGFGEPKTSQWNVNKWAGKIGLGRKAVMQHLKYLEEHKHIKIIHQKGYVEGGGKIPYSYAPAFPTTGNIWLKKNNKEEIINKGWT